MGDPSWNSATQGTTVMVEYPSEARSYGQRPVSFGTLLDRLCAKPRYPMRNPLAEHGRHVVMGVSPVSPCGARSSRRHDRHDRHAVKFVMGAAPRLVTLALTIAPSGWQLQRF